MTHAEIQVAIMKMNAFTHDEEYRTEIKNNMHIFRQWASPKIVDLLKELKKSEFLQLRNAVICAAARDYERKLNEEDQRAAKE
jgi:hypothetical protein